MKFSSRIKSVEASTIMELLTYAAQAKKQGKKVYHLNIGQPDIKTPENFFEAISNDRENVLEYALSEGLPELREAIQKYYKEYDINFDIEDILILNGGSEALFFTMIT